MKNLNIENIILQGNLKLALAIPEKIFFDSRTRVALFYTPKNYNNNHDIYHGYLN